MNRIRIGIGACVLAVAIGAGGYAAASTGGGPPTVTEPALVASVNSICNSYTSKFEAMPGPSFDPASATAAQLGQAAGYLNKIVPLEQAEQHAVTAAGRPDTNAGLYSSVLTALTARVGDEAAAQQAADARNLAKFRAIYARDQADSARLSGIAQQFGLTSCA